MASVSRATNGEVAVGTSLGDIVALATIVAAAFRWGSHQYTRHTHKPLQDLIRALNGDEDIYSRRFRGGSIYDDGERGTVMTMKGEMKSIAMGEMTKSVDEHPTVIGTTIVCLSVVLSRETLSSVLASAVLLYSLGTVERSMQAELRSKITRYADAVLSRDTMCGRLERKMKDLQEMVQREAPGVAHQSMFLPPATPQEEGDFSEFLVQLWSSQADGSEIWTRSVKLLGMALLLAEYGWQIDVFVEGDEGDTTPLKTDTRALSVIYSCANNPNDNRKYVENHSRHAKGISSQFYPTAHCPVMHMGETSGLSLSKTAGDCDIFRDNYMASMRYCQKFTFEVSVTDDGKIRMRATSVNQHDTAGVEERYERQCRRVLKKFAPINMPNEVRNIVVGTLCNSYPDFDWSQLEAVIDRQKFPEAAFTTLIDYFDGNAEKMFAISGTLLGVLDVVIRSIINLPDSRQIRTPTNGGLYKFVQASGGHLGNLFDGGLLPGSAVQLCAIRLAGVDPDSLRGDPNNRTNNAIGYWNGQQGILLTPILERQLYSTLSSTMAKPLSLFNIPIEGMPYDDRGWINSGHPPNHAICRAPLVDSLPPGHCHVVLVYRPHFERDSNSVVAAAYIDGKFFGVLSLGSTLAPRWNAVSRCGHVENVGRLPFRFLDLRDFEVERVPVAGDSEGLFLVSPQRDEVSRLVTTLIYSQCGLRTVVQNGCLECALGLASPRPGSPRSIVIPRSAPRERTADASETRDETPTQQIIRHRLC